MDQRIFHRPKLNVRGRLVARRELRFGTKLYQPGEAMPYAEQLGLSERDVRVLWEQYQLDTYGPDDPLPEGVADKVPPVAGKLVVPDQKRRTRTRGGG